MQDIDFDSNERIDKESSQLLHSQQSSSCFSHRRFYLGMLTVVYVSNFLDRTLVTILLEPIKIDFSLTDTQVGLLGGLAFSIFYTTAGLPVSRLADKYSRIWILTLCIIAWSVFTAAQGLAQNFIQLLLLRLSVGLGESGANPISHSIIADLYPSHERGGAMAIYSIGISAGTLLGTLGGVIGDVVGWRWCFVFLGLPGVLLAILVRLFLRDIPKNYGGFDEPAQSPWHESLVFILKQRAFIHQALAGGWISFTGYGNGTFSPSFWSRIHGLSLTERSILGTCLTLFGCCGTLLGGFITDRWSRKRNGDHRPFGWLPALACIPSVIFGIMSYHVSSYPLAVALTVPGELFDAFWRGPCFAMGQSLTPKHSHAFGAALLLFILNAIGLGLGPLILGSISTALEPSFGINSVRWAMTIGKVGNLLASLHFWLSTHTINEDKERASQESYDIVEI